MFSIKIIVCLFLFANNKCRGYNTSEDCGNLSSIRTQLVAVRVEQERQAQSLEDVVHKFDAVANSNFYGKSCAETSPLSQNSKMQTILVPEFSNYPFMVACDPLTQGGGWTIFLRRLDGSEDFYRDWQDYKNGFGTLEKEYFLGLEKLHAMITAQDQELLVLLEDYEGERKYELYDNFKIGGEQESYKLESLGKATGNAGDSMIYHLGSNFTTRDRDATQPKCATAYTGAWWYKECHHSNLAGKYGDNTFGKGLNWLSYRGHTYSLKTAIMMIRPKKF